jgi:DNA-binding transcriptional LysR family regulator
MTDDAQWDLFRTFEAVVRRGGFSAAARALGLSQSTVSRHIALLEANAGSPLLERTSPPRPTERGASVLAAVEPMVGAAVAARAALEGDVELRGDVTLTTVGEVVRWVLARHLPELYRAYPQLRLKILADSRIHSLAADEADIAVRGARPTRGDLVARKLAVESFGLFAASSTPLGRETPWLGLSGVLATIPEQRYARRAFAARPPRLLVEDIDALGIAVEAGLGVGILPRAFARRLDGLVEVRPASVGAVDLGAIPSRAFWLVVHRSKQKLPRVRAVAGWLDAVFRTKALSPRSERRR